MDSSGSNPADVVLDELFSALESIETQTGAILQFLKEKGMATDKELAPYLEAAGNASNVRWRAERLRINSLLASAMKSVEESLTQKVEKAIGGEQDKEQEERRHDQRKERSENRDEGRNEQTLRTRQEQDPNKGNSATEEGNLSHHKAERKNQPEAA